MQREMTLSHWACQDDIVDKGKETYLFLLPGQYIALVHAVFIYVNISVRGKTDKEIIAGEKLNHNDIVG